MDFRRVVFGNWGGQGMTDVTDRLQEVEDRLDNVDIEDIADRLEIVEDWDASDRLSDVESDLETLESRVEALEGKSK